MMLNSFVELMWRKSDELYMWTNLDHIDKFQVFSMHLPISIFLVSSFPLLLPLT